MGKEVATIIQRVDNLFKHYVLNYRIFQSISLNFEMML